MLKLTRLFVLIAVALLAARPAVACCATAPATASLAMAAEDTSCHDKAGMSAHTPGERDEAPADTTSHAEDCPGCRTCATAMANAQTFDDARVMVQAQPDAPVAVLEALAGDIHFKAVPLKTGGPPGILPRRHDTPITLKQRLLV